MSQSTSFIPYKSPSKQTFLEPAQNLDNWMRPRSGDYLFRRAVPEPSRNKIPKVRCKRWVLILQQAVEFSYLVPEIDDYLDLLEHIADWASHTSPGLYYTKLNKWLRNANNNTGRFQVHLSRTGMLNFNNLVGII